MFLDTNEMKSEETFCWDRYVAMFPVEPVLLPHCNFTEEVKKSIKVPAFTIDDYYAMVDKLSPAT